MYERHLCKSGRQSVTWLYANSLLVADSIMLSNGELATEAHRKFHTAKGLKTGIRPILTQGLLKLVTYFPVIFSLFIVFYYMVYLHLRANIVSYKNKSYIKRSMICTYLLHFSAARPLSVTFGNATFFVIKNHSISFSSYSGKPSFLLAFVLFNYFLKVATNF